MNSNLQCETTMVDDRWFVDVGSKNVWQVFCHTGSQPFRVVDSVSLLRVSDCRTQLAGTSPEVRSTWYTPNILESTKFCSFL